MTGPRRAGAVDNRVRERMVGMGQEGSLTIAAMRETDLGRLYAMYCEVVADGGASPQGGVPSLEVFEKGWIRDRDVFVARREGQVVGTFFVRCNFPAFAAHIAQSGYIVARTARGQGVGTQLVEASLKQARELGYEAMMFNLVFETNPSRVLYELPDTVGLAHPGLASFNDQTVVVGLRPEQLSVVTPASSGSVIEGDVDRVEALGSELLVHFRIDANRVRAEGANDEEDQLAPGGAGVARVDPREPIKAGQRCRFVLDVERLQFFDPSSGSTIGAAAA